MPSEPSPCSIDARFDSPPASSGPARFDAFVAAYAAAAPEARPELVAKLLAGGEPVVGDDGTVVFVYAGPAREVRVIGDFRARSPNRIDWDPRGVPLVSIVEGGDVRFARLRFAPDARLDYQLVLDGVAQPDPANPHGIESGLANGAASELTLPAARVAPLRTQPPRGTLTDVTLHPERPALHIYTPPGYDPTRRYPVLYTADGAAWRDLIQLPQTLDELLDRCAIEPAIAVMIETAEDRSTWYMWNPAYLAYLDEVVAYVDAHYPTRATPAGRVHLGTSAGGRASLQVALERPALFANVALLSPSLTVPIHLYAPYASGERRFPAATRVWLSAGTYEGSICDDTHLLARTLRDAGLATRVTYTREGHSFGTWRHVLPEALVYFLGPRPPPPDRATR